MDKYLILKQLLDQDTPSAALKASECPDETAYWDFWDEEDRTPALDRHFKSCAYCKAELIRVGRAMILAPEPELSKANQLLDKLVAPLAQAKVVLQSIGGNIQQIFNPLEVLPVYRSAAPKALVLAAGDKSSQVEIEVITDANAKYSLYVSLKKCAASDGLIVQIERDGTVLRSVRMQVGERSALGVWASGVYSFGLVVRDQNLYRIELDLR